MKKYKEICDKYNLKPKKYKIIGKVVIVTCDEGSYVIKPKNRDTNTKILELKFK